MGDKLICITKNRKAMKIIILHDADARIEYLDVADHLLGSDIEEFLTRQGFSVNNITWLVTSADHIPVVYHKYDIDCKTGEATHTKREAELQDLTILFARTARRWTEALRCISRESSPSWQVISLTSLVTSS